MGCKNSKEVQVLEIAKVSINARQNSILNTYDSENESGNVYEFCDKCVLHKTHNTTHCNRCDQCHDNRQTLFCDFCNVCINFTSEIDIMRHRKRHAICKLLRERIRSI